MGVSPMLAGTDGVHGAEVYVARGQMFCLGDTMDVQAASGDKARVGTSTYVIAD